jgi:thioredoxin reductase (NADPH)
MKQIDERDVLIVGGGPAGMTAALWCAELKLSALLIDENKEPGGAAFTHL